MTKMILLVLALGACTDGPLEEERFDYTCKLYHSCGGEVLVSEIPLTMSGDEAKDFANEWNAACSALASIQVAECGYVLCGAECKVPQ